MSNQINHPLPYPAGYIQYVFKMHVAHDTAISYKLIHSNARELILEKINPSDDVDPEWRMTIHFGPVCSIEEVDKIGNAIKDDFFDILSLTLITKISGIRLAGHGLTPRQGEGAIAHNLSPSFECKASAKVSCARLSSNDIQEIQDIVSSSRHKALFNVFRHAVGTDEPIVQFLILYLILEDLYCNNQGSIDEQILKLQPDTLQSTSPHNTRKLETVYTKLRNELTHRIKPGPETTRAEIMNNLDDFRMIVHKILKKL